MNKAIDVTGGLIYRSLRGLFLFSVFILPDLISHRLVFQEYLKIREMKKKKTLTHTRALPEIEERKKKWHSCSDLIMACGGEGDPASEEAEKQEK